MKCEHRLPMRKTFTHKLSTDFQETTEKLIKKSPASTAGGTHCEQPSAIRIWSC